MLRVKICGITRPEDARAAATAGADAIGLVFVRSSPRYVGAKKVERILAALPPLVTPVGVFMNATLDQILDTTVRFSLPTVQLHGDETIELAKALAPLAVIKALGVRDKSIYKQLIRWTRAGVSGILLDKPRTAGRSSSAPMPWHLLTPKAIEKTCGRTAPLFLAGGLTPGNVAEAVRTVRPYGVDVSSGVERSPGVKDPDLIQAFVSDARKAMDGIADDR
jgi:phosphoribosylanthranilate isomerase